jgi:uncharacterized phage protein (TIGR01671 family)
MNREIEFRVWDKIANEMLDLSSKPNVKNYRFHEYYYDLRLIAIDSINELSTDKNFGLMQFTGLLDKNGKKIFENDILKIYYQNNQKSYLKEVKWLNDAFNKGRWDALDNCVYTSCEVVGNIFENPELLAEINNN